jgi:hypothetical protein
MILEIKNLNTESLITGGRSPPKVLPDCDLCEPKMWGPRGYLDNMYRIRITGGELESNVVWPVLLRYINMDDVIGYSPVDDIFFKHAGVDVESYRSIHDAFRTGRFNLVYVNQVNVAKILPFMKSYTGSVVARVTQNDDKLNALAAWYSQVQLICLGTNATYVVMTRKRTRAMMKPPTLPEFTQCNRRTMYNLIFTYVQDNVQDGKLQLRLPSQSTLVEPVEL